jgi:hypothetical protein
MADTVHEVEIEFTRRVTFHVKNPQDLHSAIYRAEASLWEGDCPDDEGMPSSEVKTVRVGEREFQFSYHYDWNGPTVRGLHQIVTTVRLDGEKVAESRDFKTAVGVAEAALEGGDA